MNIPPLTQRFVLHFGEMGSRWGINRTVGQIYALLYVSAKPLNADEVAEALAFSRSNVSMGLKELQSWNLVKLMHQPNDRREYFQAPDDVWTIFRTLANERRKREHRINWRFFELHFFAFAETVYPKLLQSNSTTNRAIQALVQY